MSIGIAIISVIACGASWFLRRRTYKELTTVQHLLQTIEHTNDFFFYCELHPIQKYKYLSPGFKMFFGEESMKAHMARPVEMYIASIHEDDVHIVQKKLDGTADYSKPFIFRIRTQQGTYRWFEEYATPTFHNGRLIALTGIYRDVHERVLLQKKLEHKALHDQLTNVKNRTYFEEQLLVLNTTHHMSCGIIICDLDNLKRRNDNEGHKVGDAYIQQSAQLLQRAIGDAGDVCRIGGDEFAIVCKQLTREQLQQCVQKIEHELQRHNEQSVISIHLSLGYNYATCCYGVIDDVFKAADAAMYAQKLQRKERITQPSSM